MMAQKALRDLSDHGGENDDTMISASPMVPSTLGAYGSSMGAADAYNLVGPDGYGFAWKSSGTIFTIILLVHFRLI